MSTTSGAFADPPHVLARGADGGPLVVLLHGRGSDAADIVGLADHLPAGLAYQAVRAPIPEGGGFAWFTNRGIGRPLPESLGATTDWFRTWLDREHGDRPVVLVGFSGGAAFAGGLLLRDPERFAGVAVLHGTLPFDAGVPATPDRLAGRAVFLSLGDLDTVIPVELQQRTWRYLVEESGAHVVARTEPTGHQLTPTTVAALAQWLDSITEEYR